MTAPAVEIVAPSDSISEAMAGATADGLPPNARVTIVERASANADVVVQVQWSDGERQRARIVVRTSDGRTAERTLTFGSADPATERGRTLGFAVAAMIPEDLRADDATRPQPATPPGATSAPAPPPSPVPAAPTVPAKTSEARDHSEEPRLRRSLWLDASAQGGVGIGGSATALGGALALRVPFEHVALRVGGAFRAGSISEAGASSTVVRGDAGIAFFTLAIDPHVTVGARTGIVVLRHALTRTEPNGVQTSGGHTLFGAEAVLEGSVTLSSRIAVLLALGAEVAFGQTAVVVSDARVAELPPLRGISELGARFAF
jgi:hypothetical protein